jgi:hypothetical protein
MKGATQKSHDAQRGSTVRYATTADAGQKMMELDGGSVLSAMDEAEVM